MSYDRSMYGQFCPPSQPDPFAAYLTDWWWQRGQYQFSRLPWGPQPSREEQVQQLAAEFEKEAQLAAVQLVNFLGTPQGQIIAAAVESSIPQPYAEIVQAALMVVAQKRGAGRQALAGVGAVMAALVLIVVVQRTGVALE